MIEWVRWVCFLGGLSNTSPDIHSFIHFGHLKILIKTTIIFAFRTPNESEPLPSELKEPIAIANDLLFPPPPVGDSAIVAIDSQSGVPEESNSVSEGGEESLGKVNMQPGFIIAMTKILFVS